MGLLSWTVVGDAEWKMKSFSWIEPLDCCSRSVDSIEWDDLSQQQRWATEIPILRQCKQSATMRQWRDWQGFSGRILRQDSLPFCFSGSYHWLAGVVKQIVVILPNELHQAQPEWEWQTQTNRPCTRLFTTNIHLSFCCSSRPQSFNLTLVVLRHRRPLLQYSWSGWLAGKSCWRKNENISQGGLFSVVWRGLEPVELSIGSWYAMTMFWQYGVGGWGERERCYWVTRCLLDGAPLVCSPQWLPPGLLVYLPYAAYVLGCREFQELSTWIGWQRRRDETRQCSHRMSSSLIDIHG